MKARKSGSGSERAAAERHARLDPSTSLDDGKKLGMVIAALMKAHDMEPEELARRAGVDEKSVEHWSAGRRIISNSSLPRIARAFGTVPSQLWRRAERL